MLCDHLVSARDYDQGFESVLINSRMGGLIPRRILVDTSKPLSYSRWKVIQKAETEWVCYWDDDIRIAEDWHDKIFPYLEKKNVIAVEGVTDGYLKQPKYLTKKDRIWPLNTLIKLEAIKGWKPDSWMHSYEDISLLHHALKFGDWVSVPVGGHHSYNMKRSVLLGGVGYRETFGARTIPFFFKLGLKSIDYARKKDRYGLDQNYGMMKGILSRRKPA